MKISLFTNSSQKIGARGLKLSWLDGGYPGVVIRKFGEERSKP